MRIFKIAQSEFEVINNRIYQLFQNAKDSKRISWKPATENWLTIHPEEGDVYYSRTFLGVISSGGSIGSVIPTYEIIIEIEPLDDSTYARAHVSLLFNRTMSRVFQDMERIASGTVNSDSGVRDDMPNWIESAFGLSNLKLPHVFAEEKARTLEDKLTKKVRLTRTKRAKRNIDATELFIFIQPKRKVGYEVYYQVVHLETSIEDKPRLIKDRTEDGKELTTQDALAIFERYIQNAKSSGYVDETSLEYIPEGANAQNFDFNFNTWKAATPENNMTSIKNPSIPKPPTSPKSVEDIEELLGGNKKVIKTAQNFEGYFIGNVPDYATQYLGTSAVEASQIEAMFGKAHEAINLVNQFDSSLLHNISFIFNFAKSGAYGVYLSELDRAIKTKALQKKLEQKGYEVKSTDKGLTAYPKKEANITSEAIQQDIDTVYADLESKGGTAMGINMGAVLNAAKQDAMESGSKDPEIWQWIAVLHLGGTVAHEAVHAKGNMDEGPSEQVEQSFTQWALPKINDEYKRSLESQGKGDQFTPLTITGRQRHANSKSWYKNAQLNYYAPQLFTQTPSGSDLGGRFPNGLQSDMGIQPWSMMAQEDQSIPLENRLGRQYMSKIPQDLNQEHDSIEEQLRKYTRDDIKIDPKASMEELLSAGWDEDRGYITTEGLLDEKRPKPLMVTLKKKASVIKTSSSTLPTMEHFVNELTGTGMSEMGIYRYSISRVERNHANRVGWAYDVTEYNTISGVELLSPIRQRILMERLNYDRQSAIDLALGWALQRRSEQLKSTPEPTPQEEIKPVKDEELTPEAKEMLELLGENKKLIKTATLFGWMNNLEISDGNTIPGLGDRVMAWDDRDESFSEEEDWIRQQPRYNPTYDIKGFYYRWIEPRYAPQLFDDMTRDYSNTHPAKRFASNIDPEVAHILSILSKAKSRIAKGHIVSTRFILTEDVMPIIDRIFTNNTFKISVFHYGISDNNEDIYAVWVSSPNVNEESIERVEKCLQNKSIEQDVDKLIDELTGVSNQRNKAIQEIIDMVKDTCISHDISNFNIIGSYPRDIAMKSPSYLIDSLEFRGGWADQCIKIGGLVAKKLGVVNVEIDHDHISFIYKNISVDFSSDLAPIEIKNELKGKGIDVSSDNVDLYNRDFTINMLSYDLINNKINDPTNKASDDIKNKVIRTILDPDYICKRNPIIILRALKLKIRHNMEIDSLLQKAMMDNSGLIFDGRYSDRDLIVARENVKKEGKKEAIELFKIFGLEDIEKVK